MRKSGGFTIIELIIVSIVIGVLVSLALPNYARSVERTRCAYAMNICQSIRAGAILYFRENQTFSGMTLANIETLVGASFYSDGSHPAWDFEVNIIDANDFSVGAARDGGPHDGDRLELTSKGSFTGSNYPYENPGEF